MYDIHNIYIHTFGATAPVELGFELGLHLRVVLI